MKQTFKASLCFWLAVTFLPAVHAQSSSDSSPAGHLPPQIKRVTWFGERADWSHDGKRILFVEKTFGDVYEIELATGIMRPMTHHYRHNGLSLPRSLTRGR